MRELYFCLHLTESEHWIVADQIQTFCEGKGLTLHYYRELKEGHEACIREVKVSGDRVDHLRVFLEKEKLDLHIVDNPHSVRRKKLKQRKADVEAAAKLNETSEPDALMKELTDAYNYVVANWGRCYHADH